MNIKEIKDNVLSRIKLIKNKLPEDINKNIDFKITPYNSMNRNHIGKQSLMHYYYVNDESCDITLYIDCYEVYFYNKQYGKIINKYISEEAQHIITFGLGEKMYYGEDKPDNENDTIIVYFSYVENKVYKTYASPPINSYEELNIILDNYLTFENYEYMFSSVCGQISVFTEHKVGFPKNGSKIIFPFIRAIRGY